MVNGREGSEAEHRAKWSAFSLFIERGGDAVGVDGDVFVFSLFFK